MYRSNGDVQMAIRPGWKGTDGTIFELNDPALAGYGNPPACPTFSARNPGAGQRPCVPIQVEDGPAPGELVEVS